MTNLITRYLPLLASLHDYRSSAFKADLTAGLTTAVMLVPQAMAYAMLAGLEPIVGLYAATVPTAIYALLGTSKVLAVGPVAMVSLLVAGGIAPLAGSDPVLYAAYASLLMLAVGVLQLAMGMVRLGFLVKYLSHSVIAGFTSAAALIIGLSQLKHLLGLPLERSHHIHKIIGQAVEASSDIHALTLAIGAATIGGLIFLKQVSPRFPRFLLVVVAGTLAVWGLDLDAVGVAIVGEVPSGLPAVLLPTVTVTALIALLPTTLAISLIGFMESIAVAKSFARQHGDTVDANQELRALGLANVGGAMFQGYPVTGGFSRTAVNAEAGARTGVSGLITAIIVALSLVFLTPLFFYMPKAVLAGIIMTAVFGLIDVAEVRHLWRVSKSDLGLMGVTFLGTLTLGIEEGIAIGVGMSLLSFVVAYATPHVAVLGRLPGTDTYRNIARHPDAVRANGVVALRLDGPLFFANTAFLSDTINRLIDESAGETYSVVVDAAGIGSVDSSGASAVIDLVGALESRGVRMWLATVRGPVRDILGSAGIAKVLSPLQMTVELHDAMQQAAVHALSRDAALQGGDSSPTSSSGGLVG